RNQISVTLALPLEKERKGEKEFLALGHKTADAVAHNLSSGVANRVLGRRNALKFMHHTGFIDVLKVSHVPNSNNLVRFLYDYDSGVGLLTDQFDGKVAPQTTNHIENTLQHDFLLKHIFRLQWFAPLES